MKYGFQLWPFGCTEKYDHNYQWVTAQHNELPEWPGFSLSPSSASIFISVEEGVGLQNLREAISYWHSQLQFINFGYPIILEARCLMPREEIIAEKCYITMANIYWAFTMCHTLLDIFSNPRWILWHPTDKVECDTEYNSFGTNSPNKLLGRKNIESSPATTVLKSVLEQQSLLPRLPNFASPVTPSRMARNWVTMNPYPHYHDYWYIPSAPSKISPLVWNSKRNVQKIKPIFNTCMRFLEAIYWGNSKSTRKGQLPTVFHKHTQLVLLGLCWIRRNVSTEHWKTRVLVLISKSN